MALYRKIFLSVILISIYNSCFCWGFYAHQKINYYAVFLLPPEMMIFYKQQIHFLTAHAVDPDKRRYLAATEAAHHFIDIDRYGNYPFDSLPRKWEDAITKYSADTLRKYGIVPWWILAEHKRLIQAFRQKDKAKILKLSSEIGHYIADAHVPLHTSSNHNGQKTGQEGIHAFWESRIPELLAEKEWNFYIGKAAYIKDPSDFTWKMVLESAAAADTVLQVEKELSVHTSPDIKFAFETRNGKLLKQYSTSYSKNYNSLLNGMIERRMRQSVYAVACFWLTAWIDAGQPDLSQLTDRNLSDQEKKEFDDMEEAWRKNRIMGREE